MRRIPAALAAFTMCLISAAQPGEGLLTRHEFNGASSVEESIRQGVRLYNVAPAEDRFGNPRHALFIQGNPGSYINLGAADSLKPREGTVSLWIWIEQPIYKGEGIEHSPIFFIRSHAGEDFNEAVSIAYGFNLRKLHANVSQSYLYPQMTAYLRQWYHVAVTWDDATTAMYVDGELKGSAAKAVKTEYLAGDSIILGCRVSLKNKRYFQGIVDDINIYDRALSGEEIRALYEAPDPNRLNIVLRWAAVILFAACLAALMRWIVRRRVRQAIEAEKTNYALINKAYEQEIKALKTQMNPHFIFNALNSIQQFILVNDNENALAYLSKFARLVRKILESSTLDSISLREEINIIRSYIEIESLRFGNSFGYQISISDQLANLDVQIPHFLVQPFVENAIWHGLLRKDGERTLHISFDLIDEDTIACSIDDNGLGRSAGPGAGKEADKRQSLAVEFVRQRLDLLGKKLGKRYGVYFMDKSAGNGESEGTCVLVHIPVLKKTQHVQSHNH